jgi:hypothetical protein
VQTEQPKPIAISASGNIFKLGSTTDSYQLLDNYSMAPDMDYAFNLLLESEAYVHPELQTSVTIPQIQNYEAIYDLQGRRVLVPHGLNIIRYSDGTIKKLLTK